MDEGPVITGGYILVARKTLESDLMNQSPLTIKLWTWFLLKANWKAHGPIDRGELLTTVSEMQEAMSHCAGWRKITPTKDEIRSCYEALRKATRVVTRKTTRGMVVSVLNYETYQDPKNYEAHTGSHNENGTVVTAESHYKERREENNKKTPLLDGGFDAFWNLYPRKTGKLAARKSWDKHRPPVEKVLETLSWQIVCDDWTKDAGQFIPHAATWLNSGRWDDEPPEAATGSFHQGGFFT